MRAAQADLAVREALRAHWEGEPALVVDAPPGAGKTGLVVRTAAQSAGVLEERCVVVTQTNDQSFDVAERFTAVFGRMGVTLLCRERLALPDRATFRRAPIRVVHSPQEIPEGPCVVVVNAKKLLQSRLDHRGFGTMIVDEAYQLPNHEFLGLAPLAEALVLVGDPGQIAPVIRSDVTRWAEDAAGPHTSAPDALLATHPGVRRVQLPVSRRLVQDTVGILQPAFYPKMLFEALESYPERRLTVSGGAPARSAGERAMDEALARAVEGISLTGVILPEAPSVADDAEIARMIAEGVVRAHEVGLRMGSADEVRPVDAQRIGVVCASRNQVRAVMALLPRSIAGQVLVETANRYQGLERDLMLVWHPLTGRPRTGGFHLDAGRLCVMLSRHRGACVIYARPDVFRALDAPPGRQVTPLGAAHDMEGRGRAVHASLLAVLSDPLRCVHVDTRGAGA